MISTSTRVRSEAIPVWHFLPADWRLRFGPRTLVTPGLVLAEDRPLQMCEVGLHGARRAIDAFIYSPGPVVSHCLIWGDVIEDDDNLCGSRREHVAMADATPALYAFTCDLIGWDVEDRIPNDPWITVQAGTWCAIRTFMGKTGKDGWKAPTNLAWEAANIMLEQRLSDVLKAG